MPPAREALAAVEPVDVGSDGASSTFDDVAAAVTVASASTLALVFDVSADTTGALFTSTVDACLVASTVGSVTVGCRDASSPSAISTCSGAAATGTCDLIAAGVVSVAAAAASTVGVAARVGAAVDVDDDDVVAC